MIAAHHKAIGINTAARQPRGALILNDAVHKITSLRAIVRPHFGTANGFSGYIDLLSVNRVFLISVSWR